MISARRLTAELHVEVLGLDLLHRRADPDPGVVDQHVEAAVGLAVLGEDADHVLLVGHVGGDALHLDAVGAQPLGRGLQLLRAAGGDGQRVALLAQRPGDRQPDPARCPRDQRRSLRQLVSFRSPTVARTLSAAATVRGRDAARRPSITCRAMRLSRVVSALACLLAAAALVAGCGGGSSSSTASSLGHGRKPPGAAEERIPQRQGQDPRRGARIGRRPLRPGRLPGRRWSSTRARTATRSASSSATAPRSPTRRSPSTSPRCRREQRQQARQSTEPEGKKAVPTAAKKALDQPAVGPFPAAIESLATQPAFRAQTTAEDPDAATVVYATNVDFPSDGEWRIAALIKQGDKTDRDAAAQRRGRRIHQDPAGRPEGAADPHADRRRASAATSPRSPPASRRTPRTRSITQMCSAKNRSSSCLRPPSSARVGSAARSSTWPSRSNSSTATRRRSSTWRSTTKTIRARACARRCGRSTCPASRGCS